MKMSTLYHYLINIAKNKCDQTCLLLIFNFIHSVTTIPLSFLPAASLLQNLLAVVLTKIPNSCSQVPSFRHVAQAEPCYRGALRNDSA